MTNAYATYNKMNENKLKCNTQMTREINDSPKISTSENYKIKTNTNKTLHAVNRYIEITFYEQNFVLCMIFIGYKMRRSILLVTFV